MIVRKMLKWKLVLIGFLSLMGIWLIVFRYGLAKNPEGKYIEDKIGFAGLSYFEYKNGEVFIVMSEDSDRSDGRVVRREKFASYTLRNGEWMLTADNDDEPIILKAGLLSIRWVNSSGEVEYEVPRLFSLGGRVFRIYRPNH